MRRLLVTYVTIALAGAILASDFFAGINLFHAASHLFERIARNRVYALVTAVLVIIVGLCIDLFVAGQKAKRETEIQAQRLRVLKAAMRTVQEIVNNAFNELQLFRLDAEDLLPQESLKLFDGVIRGTAAKLKVLADLESTPETISPFGPIIDRELNFAGKDDPL
ncbi:MAG TPA: hypothetical protein VNO24_15345 [Blastocatellia bacterium]|nr:hypothetical protein [Blastocatellia bacterium]